MNGEGGTCNRSAAFLHFLEPNHSAGKTMKKTIMKRQRPVRQRTRALVRFTDAASRALITVGGIGTIVAVALVFMFLVWVAVPLFFPAKVSAAHAVEKEGAWVPPLHVGVDEYMDMAWTLHRDGHVAVYQLQTGDRLRDFVLFGDGVAGAPTAFSSIPGSDEFAMGFGDGSVRLGKIGFKTRFIESGPETASLGELGVGESIRLADGVVTRTPAGQLRVQEVDVDFGDPMMVGSGSPIALIAHAETPSGPIFAVVQEDGSLLLSEVRQKRNMLTGKTTANLRTSEVRYQAPAAGLPSTLLMSGLGASLVLIWGNGSAIEFATHKLDEVLETQRVDLLATPEARLTDLSPMIGSITFVVGDDTGAADVWFPVRDQEGSDPRPKLTQVRSLPRGEAPVAALAPSSRSRAIAVGYADGSIQLMHTTSNKLLAELKVEVPQLAGPSPVALAMAPKDDGLVAMTEEGIWSWRIDLRHPEASIQALFRPVWYEGYPKAEYVWQSSSGTDDFEPKLSLVPLIFGTLKATVYSAMFGVPMALLAAICTSEFFSRRWRTPVKSTVELMAALPSVVLGFLAALIIAPFVERWLPVVLSMLVTLPVAVIVGACLWQLLPRSLYLRLSRFRLIAVLIALLAGVSGAYALGPTLQDVLFAGDIKLWLDGSRGGPAGGWALLLFPAVAVAVGAAVGMRVRPSLARGLSEASRLQIATWDLLLVLGSIAATFLIVGGLAAGLSLLGFDPRGSVLGTYIQRNTFVVGFVMGFAIIPIIYTIAEDAFSSVPDHLRSASLAAGATQWQTVSRVVLPTAMSGVFSAVMVGLGRAVGETMIVLMAAGNTPILEWNIFSGFRTLSANLAVELPEAVRGDTHYRTLFLAALVLFLMTFAVNSVAEVVRRRYQRRSHQL